MDRLEHRAAIDQACREMTHVDLSPAFRARVMARVETTPGVVSASKTTPGVVSAVCAVAVSVAAIWLQGALRIEVPNVGGPAGRITRVSDGPAPVRNPTASPTQPRSVVLSADELGWLARALPPLAEVPAIAIAPIQPSPPSIAPISVDALGADTLELAPLEMRPSGRD